MNKKDSKTIHAPQITVAVIDPTRVIEIAQYVVEGARGLTEALAAIRAAQNDNASAPIVRIYGNPMRVWLRGHYQHHHRNEATT